MPTRASTDALAAGPCKILFIGGIGAGKGAALLDARKALHNKGIEAATALPAVGESTSALVIDDAHQLTDAQLAHLTELAGRPDITLVVAAEPRFHNAALRTLIAAMERDRPAVRLHRLPLNELPSDVADATAGIPFLVSAVSGAVPTHSDAAISQAAFLALIERLRLLDESALEALLIASLRTDVGSADLAAALDVGSDEARLLIDIARATGLVEPSHSARFLDSVHRAAAHLVGAARHHEVESALLRTQLELGVLSPGLAARLAEHGMRDDRLAATLRRMLAAPSPDRAANARLATAAVAAGAVDMRARQADALAMAGDCTAAAAVADDLLTSPEPDERATAVRVAASVAAHDGNLTAAAELFRWLGPHSDAALSASAAIAFIGVGNLAAAQEAAQPHHSGPPTAASRAMRSLADGLVTSVAAGYAPAAVRFGQALTTEQSAGPGAHVLPDTGAAIAALAALHGGDPIRARNIIGRAVGLSGGPFSDPRHRLLLAWIKAQDGQLSAASADLAEITSATTLHSRDALWTASLRTALARRAGDLGAVQKHWNAAQDVLAEYSLDLYSLLPLGELWMAAARIGQTERLAPQIENAFGLITALGNPVAWSVPLHWAGVHAGILANNPAVVAPHGQALTSAAADSPFAKALSGAGRTWLRVLAGQVEPDEVTAAARVLSQFGLTSDATRLAGQAALQTPDAKVSALMLQVARDLKLTVPDIEVGSPDAGDAPGPSTVKAAPPLKPQGSLRTQSSALSEREREVAELLLLGMPYRDIGTQLFISAKTVEHHVARIRRRLGAESRPAMLSMLRAILASDGAESAGRQPS